MFAETPFSAAVELSLFGKQLNSLKAPTHSVAAAAAGGEESLFK
jgi:hypothetical protein